MNTFTMYDIFDSYHNDDEWHSTIKYFRLTGGIHEQVFKGCSFICHHDRIGYEFYIIDDDCDDAIVNPNQQVLQDFIIFAMTLYNRH